MLTLQVRGAAEIRAAARQLGAEAKQLRAGAAKALERGARGLRKTIPAAAARLPSGYAPVMAEDVRVSTSVRLAGRDPTIGVRVWAPGAPAKGNRAVEAIDGGNLRHPLYGMRKEPWYDQAVPPGFASEPFQEARPDFVREIADEWDAMVSRVERG